MRYKFEFEAKDETIKIIPEIPNYQICRIEGRNGIGKSLSIKLLELATGAQPFSLETLAWLSLKDIIKRLSITITDFPGGDTLVWTTETQKWPDLPLTPTEDWIGTYTFNGSAYDFSSVKNLLNVVRIMGDETIIQTVTNQMREDSFDIKSKNESINMRIESVTQLCEEIDSFLLLIDPSTLLELNQNLSLQRERLHTLQRDLEIQKNYNDITSTLIEKQSQLNKMQQEFPALNRRLEDLHKNIEDITRERKEIDESIIDLQFELANQEQIDESTKAILLRLKSYEENRVDILEKIKTKESQIDSNLDLKAVQTQKIALKRRIYQLQAKKIELDKIPELKKLISVLLYDISSSLNKKIGNEVIYVDNTYSATVSHLDQRLKDRQQTLDNQPPKDETTRLENEIRELEDRLIFIDAILALYDDLANIDKVIKANRTRIKNLKLKIDNDLQERYDNLIKLSSDLADKRDILIQERALLTDQVSNLQESGSPEILEREILDLSRIIGSASIDDWLDIRESSRKQVSTIRQEFEATKNDEEKNLINIRNLENALATHISLYKLKPNKIIDKYVKSINTTLDFTILSQEVIDLRKKLLSIKDRLNFLRTTNLGLLGSLDQIIITMREYVGGHLNLEDLRSSGRLFIDEIIQFYEGEFSFFFNSPQIKQALFDGGDLIKLNLEQLSIIWKSQKGEIRTRPLEAFSSGEKAFTYTLTRLELVKHNQSKISIIALDEFGAFMAQDRLNRLIDFLKNQVLNKIADQILILLPLSQDYNQMLENSEGQTREIVKKQVLDLETKGYVALNQGEAIL